MARINRHPAYDLQRHIVTGERGPLSGDPNIQQFDQELDREDPMQFPGSGDNFVQPVDAATVNQMNLAQAFGLDSGDGGIGDQGAIDMNIGDSALSQPGTGGIAYGPVGGAPKGTPRWNPRG